MKKQEWNEGLDHLDPELVEKYIEQKDFLSKKKRRRDLWIRVGALAACLAVIVCTFFAPQSPTTPGIEPYIPNGEPWAPIIDPSVKDTIFDADEIDKFIYQFQYNDSSTNQYTKVYSESTEYLNIVPLPNAEYLPVYSFEQSEPSKIALNNFIDEYLDAATDFFGIYTKKYEIRKVELIRNSYYEAKLTEGNNNVMFSSYKNNSLKLCNLNYDEKRLTLNGSMISIMESDTDEQIKEKLKHTIDYICKTFGKEYDSINIVRAYNYEQLSTINIYIYPLEKNIFPSNFSKAPMSSEYIALTFYTDWGNGSFCDWDGSKDEAFLSAVSLYKTVNNPNNSYKVTTKAKMISLEAAEELLEKGYVFGGHSCPLCMTEQPEVDFSEYTCVNIEYLSDEKGEIFIPFYAFYKYIGETDSGIGTYAKTYVPAVEVSGLENYFRMQESKH